MKALSIIEPYATLIKNGVKRYETRSWKTNYRGKIYIHASKKKIPKEYRSKKDVMSLINEDEINYGCIICECILVDCILITEEFRDNLINENYTEFICGDYSVGRYAWVLEVVNVLDEPILMKGNLGIWNF